MQNNTITFQLATHFLSRTALRIESLLDIIKQACSESHPAIHRYALKNLIEIIELIEKPELKSRFLKELMRIEYVLSRAKTTINADLIEKLSKQIYMLSNVSGLFGQSINDSLFLKSIRQIYHVNSKDCEFNSPQLLMWLDLPVEKRQKEFQSWLETLSDLQLTVDLYLSLLRETTYYTRITTENGFYQYSLPPKVTCHLIGCKLDKSHQLMPRLQVGYHGLTIRLFDLFSLKEAKSSSIEMDLAICQL